MMSSLVDVFWSELVSVSSDFVSLLGVASVAVGTTRAEPVAVWFLAGAVLVTLVGVALIVRSRAASAVGFALLVVPLALLAFLSGTVPALAGAGAVILVATLVGSAVLRALDVDELTSSEWLVVAATVGIAVVGAAMFLLGLFGLISGPVVLFVALGLALGSVVILRRRTGAREPRAVEGRAPVVLVGAAALLVQLTVPYVVAPELMYDATYYHLTLVRVFSERGAMVLLPELFASAFPLLPQLVYTAATVPSSIDAAKFIHFGVGVIVALSVYALGARLAGPRAGAVAAAAWLATPLVLWEMSTAYVDLFSVLFATCALLVALVWVESRRPVYAALAGVACAAGLGVKVSAVFFAGPLVLVLMLLHVRSRRDLAHLSLGAALTVVLAAPWYVRSLLLTGNPVFPFLNGVFQSPLWDPRNESFNFAQFGMGHSLIDLLVVPWRLVVATNRFGEDPRGTLGLLPLLVVAGALLAVALRGLHARTVSLVLFVSLVAWFASAQYTRYLLPVLAVGAAAFGQAIAMLWSRSGPLVRGASYAVLSLAVIAAPPIMVAQMWRIPGYVPWRVDLGHETREEFLYGASRHYPLYQWMRENLADFREARVLGLGLSEWPIVYSPSRISIAHLTIEGRQVIFSKSGAEAARSVRRHAFQYVVIDYFPRPTRFAGTGDVVDEVFMQDLRLLYANRYVYLYAVDGAAEPPSREILTDPGLASARRDEAAPWVRIGGQASPAQDCPGVTVRPGSGLIQAFAAMPNTLYTLDLVMKASPGAVANGKAQINWVDAQGKQEANLEIVPLAGTATKHSMSTTSPHGASEGIVYLTDYGDAAVCVERASLRTGA